MMKRLLMGAAAAVALSMSGAAMTQDKQGTQPIPAVLKSSGQFGMLLKASKSAGVDKGLGAKGPFTVFAPTDAAFAKVPPKMMAKLMKPENRAMLKKVLGYHTVNGRLTTAAIRKVANGPQAVAVTSSISVPMVFAVKGGAITVNGAKIAGEPVKAGNGLVYTIDMVLVPPMPVQPTY